MLALLLDRLENREGVGVHLVYEVLQEKKSKRYTSVRQPVQMAQ